MRLWRGLLCQRHVLYPRGAALIRLGRHILSLEQLARKLRRLFTAEIARHDLIDLTFIQLDVDGARGHHGLVLAAARYVLRRRPQSLCRAVHVLLAVGAEHLDLVLIVHGLSGRQGHQPLPALAVLLLRIVGHVINLAAALFTLGADRE